MVFVRDSWKPYCEESAARKKDDTSVRSEVCTWKGWWRRETRRVVVVKERGKENGDGDVELGG